MKFLKINNNDNYEFKKGKFERTEVSEVSELDYITWILNNVTDLTEEERLVLRNRKNELLIEVKKEEVSKDLDAEKVRLEKLREEARKLEEALKIIEEKTEEVEAVREEIKAVEAEKEEKAEVLKDRLKDVYDIDYVYEIKEEILRLANKENFIRAETKKEIEAKIKEIDVILDNLHDLDLHSDALEKISRVTIRRLTRNDRDYDLLKSISKEDLLKVEEF